MALRRIITVLFLEFNIGWGRSHTCNLSGFDYVADVWRNILQLICFNWCIYACIMHNTIVFLVSQLNFVLFIFCLIVLGIIYLFQEFLPLQPLIVSTAWNILQCSFVFNEYFEYCHDIIFIFDVTEGSLSPSPNPMKW